MSNEEYLETLKAKTAEPLICSAWKPLPEEPTENLSVAQWIVTLGQNPKRTG